MKRFTTPAEIIELMERYKTEINTLYDKAAFCDYDADKLRGTEDAYKIEGLRGDAEEYRRRVQWRYARIETLKERLAVLQTPMLPALAGDDQSIPSL